ncbi:unnamed protein product, partial [Rotaria socialis]
MSNKCRSGFDRKLINSQTQNHDREESNTNVSCSPTKPTLKRRKK